MIDYLQITICGTVIVILLMLINILMKQSNLILAIGILVAVILIAGSLFLKADPLESGKSANQETPVAAFGQSAKKIVMKPFAAVAKHIIKIQ